MPVFESTPAGIRTLPQPQGRSGADEAGVGHHLPDLMDSSRLGRPPLAPAGPNCPLARRLSEESRANLLRCFLPPEAAV